MMLFSQKKHHATETTPHGRSLRAACGSNGAIGNDDILAQSHQAHREVYTRKPDQTYSPSVPLCLRERKSNPKRKFPVDSLNDLLLDS